MNHWAAVGQAEQRHKCSKVGGWGGGKAGGMRAGPDATGLSCCSALTVSPVGGDFPVPAAAQQGVCAAVRV